MKGSVQLHTVSARIVGYWTNIQISRQQACVPEQVQCNSLHAIDYLLVFAASKNVCHLANIQVSRQVVVPV